MNLEEFSNLARDYVKTKYSFDVENAYCVILLGGRRVEAKSETWRQDDVSVDLEQIIEIVFDWHAINEVLPEKSLSKALASIEDQIEEDLTETIKEHVL